MSGTICNTKLESVLKVEITDNPSFFHFWGHLLLLETQELWIWTHSPPHPLTV